MRNRAGIVACTVLLAAALPVVNGCGDDPPDRITGPGQQSTALRLVSVSPTTGSTAVSTAIVITGAGFNDGTTLSFGGIPVPLVVTNSSIARASAPPHAAGSVDIVVTNANGERAELTNGFRYVDFPAKLEIVGNTSLESVGETRQLTATATFSDGSTADVTREAAWSSTFGFVATVDATGVVTATGLGATVILVRYPTTNPSLFSSREVTVTPPGSFAVSGRVREPGAGGVAGARVLHVDSGQATDSGAQGYVSFGGLTGGPRLRVTKEGYEDAESEAVQNAFFDVPLQRVVRIAAGSPQYSSQLAPNDMDLAIVGNTRCQPCRLIRVTGTPGPAQVTLRWGGSETLRIWVNGEAFEAPAGTREVTAGINLGGGETLVFVGRPSQATAGDYITFNVVVLQ